MTEYFIFRKSCPIWYLVWEACLRTLHSLGIAVHQPSTIHLRNATYVMGALRRYIVTICEVTRSTPSALPSYVPR
jgi:hypothetical protein